jgi:hypothetical protein
VPGPQHPTVCTYTARRCRRPVRAAFASSLPLI